MKESDCPLALWAYCMDQSAHIDNLTVKDPISLHGSNTHTHLTDEEVDVLALCQYFWYSWF